MRQAKNLRQLNKIMQEVRRYEDVMERLSDGELAHLTAVFKKRLADGESLDDILPEAFAASEYRRR